MANRARKSCILSGWILLLLFNIAACSAVANPKEPSQTLPPFNLTRLTVTYISPSITPLDPQKLRITNQSAFPIHNLSVRFPDERIVFGDVLSGATTAYQVVSRGVYRYAAYEIELDGQAYQQVPYDFMGESPMNGSAFTYILSFDPVQKPGIEVIQLVGVKQDK